MYPSTSSKSFTPYYLIIGWKINYTKQKNKYHIFNCNGNVGVQVHATTSSTLYNDIIEQGVSLSKLQGFFKKNPPIRRICIQISHQSFYILLVMHSWIFWVHY
jgi:hypothetical protein